MTRPVARLQGFNNRGEVVVTPGKQGSPAMTAAGCIDLVGRLGLPPDSLTTLLFFGAGSRQPDYPRITKEAILVNEMADYGAMDTALRRADRFCAATGLKTLNPPRAILALRPDRLCQTLSGIDGLTVPRTVSCRPRSPADLFHHIGEQEMTFPVVVEARHDLVRAHPVRLDGPSDDDPLHSLPFDGQLFFISDFIDSRSADGHFHRQRIFCLGDRAFAMSDLYDIDWRVSRASRRYMLQQEPEKAEWTRMARVQEQLLPALRPMLSELRQRTGLDFFFIDAHLVGPGDVRLFTLRADRAPFDFPPGEAGKDARAQIAQAAREMLTTGASSRG